MGAAEVLDSAPWLIRPYNADQDEHALMYMLGIGYTRSRAGIRAGASRAGGSTSPAERAGGTPHPDTVERQKAFLAAHRGMWLWLLENADVSIACDPENTSIIWAWLVTSSPNIVHAVGCKRSLIEAELSADVVRDMLGDRLKTHQVCSLELPQMRTRGGEAIGIDRPKEWSIDPTWLLTRMVKL